MKKFIVAAIIVVAVIGIAAPIASGFVFKNTIDRIVDKANAYIQTQSGGTAPFELRQVSYDKSLFGAKAVLALTGDAFDGDDAFLLESELSFGWFLSSNFPFVALVKSHDKIRLGDEALKQLADELPEGIKDGVLLEGEIVGIPEVSLNGYYASREINFDDERRGTHIEIKPLTIRVNAKGKHNISFTANLPYFEVNEDGEKGVKINGVSLSADGDIFNPVGNAEAEFAIDKVDLIGYFVLDSFKIKGVSKVKGGTIDSVAEYSVEKIDFNEPLGGKIESIEKPYLSLSIADASVEILTRLQDRINELQKGINDRDDRVIEKETTAMISDFFEIFDKGAVFNIKASVSVNGAPLNFEASYKTDSSIKIPEYSDAQAREFVFALIEKSIIDASLSVHKSALEVLELPDVESGLEALEGMGVAKREGDLIKTQAHFEKNKWTLNDKEAPFEGLFPGQLGGGFGDPYGGYGDNDDDEEYDEAYGIDDGDDVIVDDDEDIEDDEELD
ncbi:MAG: YdgA family protein [Helicobacteraceae bacterium]|jgi:hypothetical protein|nr:YdgA family protein [Helicobacteraceae bacterium]